MDQFLGNFLLIEFCKFAALYAGGYLLGLWVMKKNVKVNYTRKILHFIIFFLPIFMTTQLTFQHNLVSLVISGFIFVGTVLLMSEPIRTRSHFFATAFAAIDRPEDRPYTLTWLSTQTLATYMVLVPVIIALSYYDRVNLIFITIIIAGIGDGLAEPVGVRFGKHKYQTRALFSQNRYTRSIEGSLCVFVVGVLAILLMSQKLSGFEMLLLLALIPITTTLAEAFSPHTWDSPFITLAGGISTLIVVEASAVLEERQNITQPLMTLLAGG